ncbi:alpha/beta fold hydrolase [Bacillus sp. FJAT-42376]|uniref:alpha/beta hydrolase n=1 Tax=Bacillus sp. FJAT-42376 TaxID=2014076 RepID=UPI000F4E312E|nr:alpha/beta fold hydrolase [Bacillus sp. FJAT-42376]AZB44471.1 alpha/beta fold hydrolase [Bacillus sp. FJAT-42376]
MKELKRVMSGAQSFSISGSSEQGILLCHGFNGTPQSMESLGEKFASFGYSVYAPRLSGHGTCPTEMESCTAMDWYRSLETAYSRMKSRFSKVFVVGQSMGGSLTLKLAGKFREMDGIALINAALEVPAYQHITEQSGFITEGKPDIKDQTAEEITYNTVPLKAISELKTAMNEAKAKLKEVSCPAIVFYSPEDHVVPAVCSHQIYQMIPSYRKMLVPLPNSYHVASMDYDQDLIVRETIRFFSKQKEAHPVERKSFEASF